MVAERRKVTGAKAIQTTSDQLDVDPTSPRLSPFSSTSSTAVRTKTHAGFMVLKKKPVVVFPDPPTHGIPFETATTLVFRSVTKSLRQLLLPNTVVGAITIDRYSGVSGNELVQLIVGVFVVPPIGGLVTATVAVISPK